MPGAASMNRVGSDFLRLLNATSSGETLHFEDPASDLARFDRLPPAVRWRIANANTKLAAAKFEPHVAWADKWGLGSVPTVRKIAELEGNEIAVFAGEYRGRYVDTLPHVAADASVQRYGERGPSQHPPRPPGKAPLRVRGRV